MKIIGFNHIQNATRNKYTILEAIRGNGGISRKELSKVIGLCPATITKFIEELIKENLVQEKGFISSAGGRRPIRLNIKPNGGYTIGVDIGSANLRVLIINLKGKIISKREEPHSQEGKEKILNKV